MKLFLLIPLGVIVAITPLVLLAFIYGRYLRISRGKAYLVALVAVIASLCLGFYRADQIQSVSSSGHDKLIRAIQVGVAFLLPLVVVPLLMRLYLTWVAGDLTEAEKAPGMEGVRAWLRGGNLVCAALTSVCLWLGFGCTLFGPLALALLALLAYPLVNMLTTMPEHVPKTDVLSTERERVLKMLDDGKINAQESAELLNALSHSAPPRPQPSAGLSHGKLALGGMALVLVGFFLPWFVVSTVGVEQAANQMMSQKPMPQGMPKLAGMMSNGLTLYVTGGDISHGLGWCVLLFGIVAATLPLIATNLDSQTCQKASLIVLGFGAIILLYLFTQNLRIVGVGLLLGLAGYALEFIGVLKSGRINWSRPV